MRIGLRIDVDTLRGTRLGVPALCVDLGERGIRASFFFSVGPDNMGRHLWRLLRPEFLVKMLRSGAPSLYGWDIVLRGTLLPGPRIAQRVPDVLRRAAEAGHEIGFHAWDHHAWQAHFAELGEERIHELTVRGMEALRAITGAAPTASACAGWRCNETVLRAQRSIPLSYQSDCRGECIFLPLVDGEPLDRPQVPVTLPTYDELIGRDGISDANYNEHLLGRLDPERLNVLTIHAEVEGVARRDLARDFYDRALRAGWSFVPLAELLPDAGELPLAPVVEGRIPGREGTVACQGATAGVGSWAGRAERRVAGGR